MREHTYADARDEAGLIEGRNAVREALRAGTPIDKLYLAAGETDRTLAALAAIAGVLLCSTYPSLMPTTGSLPGIKAFTAAVFGGIGSIPGAMLGGILLGIIEIFAKAFNTNISDAVVFAVLIVVLLVKPTGLLGKAVREKV